MLNCDKIQQSLSAYLDDELSIDDMRLTRKHLFSCYECQDKYDSLKQTRNLLGSLQSVSTPDDIWGNIVNQIKTEKITTSPWQQRRHSFLRWQKRFIIPATAAAIITMALLLANRSNNLPNKSQEIAMEEPVVDVQTQVIDHVNFAINHPLTDRGVVNYNTIDSEKPVDYQSESPSIQLINADY